MGWYILFLVIVIGTVALITIGYLAETILRVIKKKEK